MLGVSFLEPTQTFMEVQLTFSVLLELIHADYGDTTGNLAVEFPKWDKSWTHIKCNTYIAESE